jgi:type IV pilus assembly protein PilZ
MNGISLTLQDKVTLYKMYMPFVTHGGLFIPTTQEHNLGELVPVTLSFAFYPETISFVGKVIWVTPPNAHGERLQGVGLQFSGDEDEDLQLLIEKLLGELLNSDEVTYTL